MRRRRATRGARAAAAMPLTVVAGVLLLITGLTVATRILSSPAAGPPPPAAAGFDGGFQDPSAPLAGWRADRAGAEAVRPGWRSTQAMRVWPRERTVATSWAGIVTRLDGRFTAGTVLTASVRVRAPEAGATARIALAEPGGAADAVALPLRDTGWHHLGVRHTVTSGETLELRLLTDAAARRATLVLDAAAVSDGSPGADG